MNLEDAIMILIGRVVDIDQRVDPRSYQREYQKLWRKNHPHYYRDLKRKQTQELDKMENSMKQEVAELKNEISRLQNVIADLEMKMCLQSTTQNEEITSVSSVPSTQACSEEELMKDRGKFIEHK